MCKLFIRMHKWCEKLPDKRLIHLFLQYTGRWCRRGWSGCCCSWPLAYSPSPGLLWNQTYSCRSDRSPVQEWGRVRLNLFRLKSHRNESICWVYSLTTELWQTELAVQPPLLGPLHSSMSSQTWNVKLSKRFFLSSFLVTINHLWFSSHFRVTITAAQNPPWVLIGQLKLVKWCCKYFLNSLLNINYYISHAYQSAV